MGGGDPFLGVCGHVADQCVAACGVEFAEDVVEQVDRGGFAGGFKQAALSELEGEGDRALLPFAAEVGGWFAIDAQRDVITVGPDHRLAGAPLALAGVDDRLVEVGSAGRNVIERERFVFAADGCLCFGGVGVELRDHLCAGFDELATVFGEDMVVGKNFFISVEPLAQQQIFGKQRAAVAGQRAAVGGINLRADKIEVAAAGFAGATNKFQIFVAHPDDEPTL